MSVPVPIGRRKMGVASAGVLGFSIVASFLTLVVRAYQMAQTPWPAIVVLGVMTAVLSLAAWWLGSKIWRSGVRWPAIALLVWAVGKQMLPHFVYPDVLPRFLYLLATVAAAMVLVQPKKSEMAGTVGVH